MRLIDVDLLVDMLAMEPMESRTYYRANEIAANIPTAYDVDEVVEQIGLLSENAENNDLNTYDEKAAYNTAYLKAIELVKAGGVNG